MFIVIYCLS